MQIIKIIQKNGIQILQNWGGVINVTDCHTLGPQDTGYVQTCYIPYSKDRVCLQYSQVGSSGMSGQQSNNNLSKPDPW